jgi:hypothetical protein
VAAAEDAEHFVGKALAHVLDAAEVDVGTAELVQPRHGAPRLGPAGQAWP